MYEDNIEVWKAVNPGAMLRGAKKFGQAPQIPKPPTGLPQANTSRNMLGSMPRKNMVLRPKKPFAPSMGASRR